MKKILYKNPEGGVSIVYPTPKERLEPQLLTLHNREHEKSEKLRRKDLEEQAAQWLKDNPEQTELPKELQYVRKECPPFVFGQEEYEAHVKARSLKGDEQGVRDLDDSDIPASRTFRNAWVDDLPNTQINIDMAKAKEIALESLRQKRNYTLSRTDAEYIKLSETGSDNSRLQALKEYRQKLRDATESLKAVNADGKYDDDAMIELMLSECEKDLSEGKL